MANSNLMRRGAVYYVRVFVPADLAGALGGKEQIWRSLQTKDFAEAKRRRFAELDVWATKFDDMRRRRALGEDDMALATWELYQSELEQDLTDRLLPALNAGSKANDRKRREHLLTTLRDHASRGETVLVQWAADDYLHRHSLSVEAGSARYRDLCLRLMRSQIEVLQRTLERDLGNFGGVPLDSIVALPASTPTVKATDSILALFEKYERENPNGIRAETMTQCRRDVNHFAAFVGPKVRAADMARRHVREWKELLSDYPVKATETSIFRGLSSVEIVTANKRLAQPKATLTRQTVRRYMSSLGGFCRWLVQQDYLDANPVADMLPKKAPPTTKRQTFTDAALKTLFTSPLFTSCRGQGWPVVDQPGNVAVRDHRYWIPWVMLYSGARPGEVAQLNVADVRQEHGIWIMHITTEGKGKKRTKTRGSMRVVPIHSELVRLGFIRHCQAMEAAGQAQVFPEVEIPEEGQIAAEFSRRFNRYLTTVGVKTDRAIVTYSLRHTFVDRARLAGFMDTEIAAVVGHDRPTMTGRYGVEQEGTLKRRKEIVEAVKYAVGKPTLGPNS